MFTSSNAGYDKAFKIKEQVRMPDGIRMIAQFIQDTYKIFS